MSRRKINAIYLTHGDAFNLWSAVGERAATTKDKGVEKTFLKLEDRLQAFMRMHYNHCNSSEETNK